MRYFKYPLFQISGINIKTNEIFSTIRLLGDYKTRMCLSVKLVLCWGGGDLIEND